MGNSTKRKDSKGRILKEGEHVRSDGRYCYKYLGNDNKPHFLYSWKLVSTDKLPSGKRPCEALREMEKKVLRDSLDGINTAKKNMTVIQLFDRQNELRPGVKKSTQKGRQQLRNILQDDPLGHMKIEKVKLSDAKAWAIRMKKDYSYQTIFNYKRSLKAAFYTAVEDDLLRKNPFNFNLSDVIDNDTVHKMALTDEQVRNLLSFVQGDSVYQRYYNTIVVLLYTGLRISELCGLTDNDIDFENGYINITHQLSYDTEGYHATTPKTPNSIRKVPLLSPARKALLEQMASRTNAAPVEADGYHNFVFLNRKGYPMYASLYTNTFVSMVKKYNSLHKENPLPAITPHHFRHTFATNMVRKGVTIKNLQTVLGHKQVSTLLDLYSHGSAESALQEMSEITFEESQENI